MHLLGPFRYRYTLVLHLHLMSRRLALTRIYSIPFQILKQTAIGLFCSNWISQCIENTLTLALGLRILHFTAARGNQFPYSGGSPLFQLTLNADKPGRSLVRRFRAHSRDARPECKSWRRDDALCVFSTHCRTSRSTCKSWPHRKSAYPSDCRRKQFQA